MDSTRRDRIVALFHDAAERPESERQAFLDAARGEDAGDAEGGPPGGGTAGPGTAGDRVSNGGRAGEDAAIPGGWSLPAHSDTGRGRDGGGGSRRARRHGRSGSDQVSTARGDVARAAGTLCPRDQDAGEAQAPVHCPAV